MENISGFYMSTPFVIPIFSLILGLILQNKLLIYFSLAISFTDIFIVNFLKLTCKYMYSLLGVNELFILGKGIRPEGAMNCGCFIDKKNVNKLATSFGMPSGHSITAGFLLGFVGNYIKDNYKNDYKRKLSLGILILFCISIAISRIVLNCHTIQQVIIGFLIGLYLGNQSYTKKDIFINII